MKRTLGLAVALSLGLSHDAWSQAAGGNIYGTVTDESGAVLPGVTVTAVASAIGGSRTTTTGSQGDFRFLNLDPATYKLTLSLPGFATVNREVIVNTGSNVNVGFGLKVASLAETVTVTEETPIVDSKRVGTSTTFTKDELTKVPQGRDPWAVLNAVPGVIVDRVSIAGNEAGQQSIFVGKGAQFVDTMWSYDGVVITDVTSYGASSSYFDFESFDEVNVSTGGGDLKVQTGGLGLNFVVKRGTNAFHGSAGTYFSHDDLQSTNTPSELSGSPALRDGKADHIEQINDWGVDLGGPIVKDKLWFWGGYNRNDIRLFRLRGSARDKTLLKNYNAKVNWQASSKDQISLLWFRGDKLKFGRDPGYAGNNQALWDQGQFFAEEDCGLPCGMKGLWKAEWNHTFSNKLYMGAKYAFFNWGYGFDSQTGDDQDLSIDRVNDVARGSAQKFRFLKPWHTVNFDGNYFATGMGGNHELKFGFGYRHWPNSSSASYGGNQIVAIHNNDDPTDPTSRVAQVWRAGVVKFEANYTSGYLGDTFTKGRWTVNAGLRYDRQAAHLNPSTATANPLFPELVPALEFDGNVPGIKWNDLSPRVGLTVALDEKRKTIVRASYARYAGQLGPIDSQFNSPVTYNYNYLAYQWVDRNNDGFAQRNEILTSAGVLYSAGIDPANPTALTSINKIDPDYHANHDQEVIVGLEREIVPNFSIGAAYTWRRGKDSVSYTPRIDSSGRILTSADFIQLPPVSAGGFTVQPFAPNPARTGDGARLLTNREDYSLNYSGIELSANKRLANKWMLRAAFSYMDWTEGLDGPNAFQNPSSADINTIIQGGYPGGAASGLCGPCVDGGIIAPKSYGAKADSYFHAKWQLSASGMYQLPGEFELGASLLGREGYPKAIHIRTSLGADGNRRLLPPGGLDLQRHDNFWNLDLRLAKNLKLRGTSAVNLTVDLFNVFNADTVLQRNRQINSDAFDQILELANPRILRFGVRLQF
jgi:hypothetical protein